MKSSIRAAASTLAAAACLAVLVWTLDARAFCGFYVGGADAKMFNNATMVVMMRDGTRTVLSMQNNYQGPPDRFAMVVPVPVVLQKENVKTLPPAIFDRVDRLAAPRLVEYWEQDPCEYTRYIGGVGQGFGRGHGSHASGEAAKGGKVTVLAQFAVGEYEIVILGADEALALDTWLRKEGYAIPPGAEALLRPYVQAGMKFFVAKVDPTKVRFERGQAMLSPLRFHYDSESFSLPVRLGLMNSSGTQDLIVHVLARGQRYEVANYDNVAIPTNLDVNPGVKKAFAAFYATLFDRTLEKNPKAVVTEYSWDAGWCDPCPSAALNAKEILTLGGDVLGTPPTNARGFVLTRLHARYGKDSLGQDLVFKAVGPIAGGREDWGDKGIETGARPAQTNTFQGRYALRHGWTGPMACKNPQRGNWGGPPPGVPEPVAAPALKLAFAPRGGLPLKELLAPASLAIGSAGGEKLSAGTQVTVAPIPSASAAADAGAPPAPSTDAAASATVAEAAPTAAPTGAPATSAPTAAAPPPEAPSGGGCAGCGVVPSRVGAEAWVLGVGAALAILRVSRRPRRGSSGSRSGNTGTPRRDRASKAGTRCGIHPSYRP